MATTWQTKLTSLLLGPGSSEVTVGNTIDAAALQAEMAKKYGLSASSGSKRPRRRQSTDDAPKQHVVCRSCGHSIEGSEFCEKCGYFPDHRHVNILRQQQQESLAFRRGLNLGPQPTKISEALKPLEWYLLEKSILQKADPDACCPICMESFRGTDEVLLSCRHIFHKVCLRSFENFIQNADLSCPICRTKNYQKKVTNLGTLAHQRLSARKIQSVWRGFEARRNFRQLLRVHYQHRKDGVNEDLRRRFHEQELTSFTRKLDSNMASRAVHVNSLLTSMERTIDDNRQLDCLFDEMLKARERRQIVDAQLPTYTLLGPSYTHEQSATAAENVDILSSIITPRRALWNNFSSQQQAAEAKSSALIQASAFVPQEFCVEAAAPWGAVHAQALARGATDCAICMLSVSPLQAAAVPDSTLRGRSQPMVSHTAKKCVILSCSHVFHEHCVGNFERFAREESQQNCPVCRSKYSKRLL